MEDFYRDLGQTYRKVVRAFADAGCRYLQLDEVNLDLSVRSEADRSRCATAATIPDEAAGRLRAA